MKAEDLRTLDGEELTTRLKGARRELYELRFKLAVGQLDDHRQIRQVRKDIARILTVVHARRLGEEILEVPIEDDEAVVAPAPAAVAPVVEAPAEAPEEATDEETPENVETAEEAPAPRPRARRRTAGGEGND
ncbi:MAG TPA: 50S ribosomal protein L29 [Terriglobales bacterium]|nr:50S ribosomal protein L29 [Terriglobales bacterium]